ncbi:hypothetical protein CEE69_28905 [Rhodopirellula bahusiensis]|uniref:Uncharacterized protein n=1 Tax=Rhodopirellula bahusiensis TaxID=2014065 RepID=A0A2G1VYL8_9BACT|nr:hypothetical protein CEE69_28905 [Rhodopirellula bahusiensis]
MLFCPSSLSTSQGDRYLMAIFLVGSVEARFDTLESNAKLLRDVTANQRCRRTRRKKIGATQDSPWGASPLDSVF